jgi:RNA polymerase sigma-70 factor (ECF subfamily)
MIKIGASKDNILVLRMFSSTTKPRPASYPLVNGSLTSTDPLATSAEPVLEPISMAQLVDDHFDFVWRMLRRMGLPAPDADDAAQQVFLLACTKQDQIRRGSERSFLYGCALNWSARYRSNLKKRVSHIDLGDSEQELAAPGMTDPEALLSAHQSRAILDQILEQLPLELRTTLVLYELEQMTSQEIADLAGIPRGTVASRLRKAREEFERIAKRYVAHSVPEGAP